MSVVNGVAAAVETVRLEEVIADFETQRTLPMTISYGERVEAFGALSRALLGREVPELVNAPGLAFLAAFLSPSGLKEMMKREVGDLDAFDHFVAIGPRKRLRLVPRGIACHWIAGNVPLLGALSWALSAAVGNLNIVRLSTRQDDMLTPLLRALARLSPAGAAIARRTAVVRFPREDQASHEAMSRVADVRIAWGGKEAVESIRGLQTDWDADTIVLGPRVSLAVVDPLLAERRQIDRLASDIAYFDQQACSSPQRVFVKGRRGDTGFDAFVAAFTERFAAQSRSLPRHPLDHSETYRIELDRTRVLIEGGTVARDQGTQWTVAVVDEPLAPVQCANRFIQVVPFDAVDEVLSHVPRNAQTAVTLLRGAELERFTEGAALRGVCRFPRPGEGNNFETPWDGVPLVSRLARWVLRTDSGS